jgi:3-hydroxyisobutyrate dehydrogenase
MAKIGFIGLGLMGLPMARNLIRSGHAIKGMEIDKVQVDKLVAAGGTAAMSVKDAVSDVDVVVTMLPDLQHVREIYMRPNGVIASARAGTLLIDCSTIDVESTRTFAIAAERAGLAIVDAPTSGGVAAAEAGRLTFMVGGRFVGFARAKPILTDMGTTVVHAGLAGNGQAAKICNNMILGVSMIAVSEAFALAEKLGLDSQKMFEISSKSSGQCWAMTSYCPVPGPVPSSPANRNYQPGFTAAMMLRDLKLAQDAAKSVGAKTQLGADAFELYSEYVQTGEAERDFSGIIQLMRST